MPVSQVNVSLSGLALDVSRPGARLGLTFADNGRNMQARLPPPPRRMPLPLAPAPALGHAREWPWPRPRLLFLFAFVRGVPQLCGAHESKTNQGAGVPSRMCSHCYIQDKDQAAACVCHPPSWRHVRMFDPLLAGVAAGSPRDRVAGRGLAPRPRALRRAQGSLPGVRDSRLSHNEVLVFERISTSVFLPFLTWRQDGV